MPSYAITGAARGLGFEWINQLSVNPSNVVFALVRNENTASKLNALAKERKNIHVIQCDVTKPDQVMAAAKQIDTATGGSLDVLVHNGTSLDMSTTPLPASAFTAEKPELTRSAFDGAFSTGIYGALWITNALIPLIKKGEKKSIVHITSGIADLHLTKVTGIDYMVPYAIAKAGMNVLVAKWAVELKDYGIKVLALSPGWVDTRESTEPRKKSNFFFWSLQPNSIVSLRRKLLTYCPIRPASAQELAAYQVLFTQFQRVKPDLTGAITPEDSVRMQLEVVDRLDDKMSGAFVSHHGDQNWF